MKRLILSLSILASTWLQAQNNTSYWQQHVDYKMDVDMNVDNYQYTGTQELQYTNNSPDTLKRVFYHLYPNAFQPGSEMDVRSRTIKDPDRRVRDRISKLSPSEIGYLKVSDLTQDGEPLKFETSKTILEVELAKPILPGQTVDFHLNFEGQVPVQIRRSGRNNAEGVALSMSQWYPKMAEYDFQGWHADPYIAREFHGVWGNFDVSISIDKNYVVGASGYLQNPNEIGYNYEEDGARVNRGTGEKLTWHFVAPQVHDFTWAADPEYVHDKLMTKSGKTLNFLYKNNPEITENWKKFQPKVAELFEYYNKHIGQYPWKQYSVIQGGDGGMEYAMLTLITGERELGSLIGVTAHEMAHAWFQHLLATNESKNEWMDEGFTSYISTEAMNEVMGTNDKNPHTGAYKGYIQLANSGIEQPQTTHADRYQYNAGYGASAYSKGEVFLAQLGYVIGKENLDKTIHRYYNDWKFKHPTPNDFIREAEKITGAELDWYLTDWTQTTNTIDYAIDSVDSKDGNTEVTLERKGLMPMPLDVTVRYTDGSEELYYIPLEMMRWKKPAGAIDRTMAEDWPWAYPTYKLEIKTPKEQIESIEIDDSHFMADVDRSNNTYGTSSEEKVEKED